MCSQIHARYFWTQPDLKSEITSNFEIFEQVAGQLRRQPLFSLCFRPPLPPPAHLAMAVVYAALPVAAMFHGLGAGSSFHRGSASTIIMDASPSLCCLTVPAQRQQQRQRDITRAVTKALFWTESYYDSNQNRWVGRVRTAEAHQTKSP